MDKDRLIFRQKLEIQNLVKQRNENEDCICKLQLTINSYETDLQSAKKSHEQVSSDLSLILHKTHTQIEELKKENRTLQCCGNCENYHEWCRSQYDRKPSEVCNWWTLLLTKTKE